MLTGLQHLHSFLRYAILIFLVWSIVNAYLKMKGNKPFVALDNKLSLYTFIIAHTQLLIGLILYFVGANGIKHFSKGMSVVMSTSVFRFFAVEHIFGMLVAIILISLGRIKSKKKETDKEKHKTIFTFFLIGLIIILVTIPWPFRNLGTAWF